MERALSVGAIHEHRLSGPGMLYPMIWNTHVASSVDTQIAKKVMRMRNHFMKRFFYVGFSSKFRIFDIFQIFGNL